MPDEQGIDYSMGAVRVFTRDLERATTFYGNTMGLLLDGADADKGFAVFRLGDAVLVVERVAADDTEGQELIGRFLGVSLRVTDLQQVFERLSGRGVRFEHPPRPQGWGGIMTHLYDPDQNCLTLVEPAG